jgi:hypothetical protein
LAELKLDMEEALQEKDLKWQEEIKKNRAKFEADIAKGVAETAELKTNIQKMTEEKEAQFRAMQAEMRKIGSSSRQSWMPHAKLSRRSRQSRGTRKPSINDKER